MDLFEHLSLIPFILVALGLIKIISAVAHYIETKNKYRESEQTPIKLYWIHTLLIAGIFTALLLYWWNSFQFNDYSQEKNQTWNLAEYTLYILPGIFLYLSLELLLPDMNTDEPIDLKEHYYSNSIEMWATLSFVAATSVMFSLFLYENELFSRATFSRIGLLFMLTPMCFTRNEKVHRILAPIFVFAMILSIPENWEISMGSSSI
ncbi:hypothetical protein OAJ94_04660 [Deltaproteobacteria bacterium]|nr:hypothetical protein [Deltaproteobacteria bacterium]